MVLFGARLVQLRRTCALLSTSPVMVPRFSDCARSLSITAHQKAPRDAYGASQLPPHCDMHLLLRRQPRSPLCDHVEGLMPSLSLEPQCLSCSPSDAGAVRCVCARADAHACPGYRRRCSRAVASARACAGIRAWSVRFSCPSAYALARTRARTSGACGTVQCSARRLGPSGGCVLPRTLACNCSLLYATCGSGAAQALACTATETTWWH